MGRTAGSEQRRGRCPAVGLLRCRPSSEAALDGAQVQRAGDDARRLLDDGGFARARLDVVLAQPHAFEFEAVPLAALAVDGVHVVQGVPVPGDQVGRWGRSLVHFPDRPGSAAERDVGEVRVGRAGLHPDLRSGGEPGRGPRFLLLLVLLGHDRPSRVVSCHLGQ